MQLKGVVKLQHRCAPPAPQVRLVARASCALEHDRQRLYITPVSFLRSFLSPNHRRGPLHKRRGGVHRLRLARRCRRRQCGAQKGCPSHT